MFELNEAKDRTKQANVHLYSIEIDKTCVETNEVKKKEYISNVPKERDTVKPVQIGGT